MNSETKSRGAAFEAYCPPGAAFDELRETDGQTRAHWNKLQQAIETEDRAVLARRSEQANRIIHENGVAYNAFSDSDGGRPWCIDLLPLAFSAAAWAELAEGVSQRAELLSLLVHDIYGEQTLLSSGDVPPELVFAHKGFLRPLCDLPIPREQRLMFFGCEVARSPDGRWWAMADRTEGPAGAGYALENRIVLSRTWPTLIHDCHVRRLAPFFMRLQRALAGLAPRATENPRVVLLTAGAGGPSYFEDVYLARYMGYTLVEGGDLAVRDDCVFIKTLDGLVQIDVIFSRVTEAELDPLELPGSSPQGVAGLLQAIRKGNVAVANAPGCGFVESPVVMTLLPQLCKRLLGEELKLPSIATWWCGDEASRKYVLEHLSELVIKPAFEHSGSEEIFAAQLTREELAQLADRIRQSPLQFVAQEKIDRSFAPVWTADGVRAGQLAMRTFAIRHERQYEIMPGALVRVSEQTGPMELSIGAGEGSKDAWIIADKPVERISLLAVGDENPELRRNSPQLPSRVADNLLWLGRHIDRAEITARLMRVIVDRLSGEREADEIPELAALIRVLAATGYIEPDYSIDGLDRRQPQIERRLSQVIFDPAERRSLRSTVNEISRLASTVRDRLSHDTWRAINNVDEHFHPFIAPADIPLDESLERLNRLIMDLAVCGGLINDGMVRGPAWRFLDIGRRLERTQLTSRLLLELIADGHEPTPGVLDGVLDVMDLQMTYRARYLAALRIEPIFDLLIADDSNPRSLIFQVDELRRHMDALPMDAGQFGLTPEQKIVADALHRLQMLDIHRQLLPPEPTRPLKDGIAASEPPTVRQLLRRMKKAMKNLSASLTRTYLVHSGTPRRIQDDPAPA